MKSRWNFAEISRRFHDWPFQIWKFSCLPIRRKMTFSKIDLFTSENFRSLRGSFFRFFRSENFYFSDLKRWKWMRFCVFWCFSFLGQNQKKMFSDLDDFWRVGRGYGDTFTMLRRLSDYVWEARNRGLNGFSILGQKQKKMFSDFIHFWRVYNRYGDTFTWLRRLSDYVWETRN